MPARSERKERQMEKVTKKQLDPELKQKIVELAVNKPFITEGGHFFYIMC